MLKSTLAGFISLALILVPAAPLRAQNSSSDAARAAYSQAKRAYNLGVWLEAADGFERAYRLSGDPVLLFDRAQALRNLGRLGEALVTYRAYLREMPDAPNAKSVEAKIHELQEEKEGEPETRPRASAPIVQEQPPSTVSEKPDPTIHSEAKVVTESYYPAIRSSETDLVDPYADSATLKASAIESEAHQGSWPLSRKRALVRIGAGSTLAFALAATAVSLAFRSKNAELSSNCGKTSQGCSNSAVADLNSLGTIANVLWLATGLTALATGVGFYVTSHEAGVSIARRF